MAVKYSNACSKGVVDLLATKAIYLSHADTQIVIFDL